MQVADTFFTTAVRLDEMIDQFFRGPTGQLSKLASQRCMPRLVCMELVLTEACNLNCTYCFEANKNRGHPMKLETALQAVDFFLDASWDAPDVSIQFLGGEPMLCYRQIQQVTEYARQQAGRKGKRICFGMTTNGTLLDEVHVRWFYENSLRYILSLDGGRADHDRHRKTLHGEGTFRRIAKKLPMFKRFQPWQGAQMVITPETAGRIRNNVETLYGLGINQFQVTFATGVDWSDQAIANYCWGLQEVFEFYTQEVIVQKSQRLRIRLFEPVNPTEVDLKGQHRWGCGAGSGSFAVSPRGTIYGCSKLASINGFDKGLLPLGQVRQGIDRPANRKKLLDRSDTIRTKCRGCELSGVCSGGCYAENYRATGSFYTPDDRYCKLMFAQKTACDYARNRKIEFEPRLGIR